MLKFTQNVFSEKDKNMDINLNEFGKVREKTPHEQSSLERCSSPPEQTFSGIVTVRFVNGNPVGVVVLAAGCFGVKAAAALWPELVAAVGPVWVAPHGCPQVPQVVA